MPTYEYRCPEGHEFEDFVLKMSDAKSELPCPTCGVVAARRMSAGSGLLFKGSGFYITDYGKDGKKAERDAAAKSETAAAATPAKPDTAPSAKPATTPTPAAPKSSTSKSSTPKSSTPKSGPAK